MRKRSLLILATVTLLGVAATAPAAFAKLSQDVLEGKDVRASTILGFRLYSRERFAVLLLSTLAGVHAFRIDTEGKLKPWSLKMEGSAAAR